MQLSIVKITSHGADESLLLNGNSIITCDPSCGEESEQVHAVAKNLSETLGLTIEYIEHAPKEDWSWDDVINTLKETNVIYTQHPGMTTLLNTTIKDWRLSEGHTTQDLNPEHCGEFTLNIEKSNNSNQVYLSVYNKAFDNHPVKISPCGLHCILEIRDGIPALSVGIEPDNNIIHVLSNTSNELAIVKEDDNDYPVWKPVDFIDNKYNGLCFQYDNSDILTEARAILADEVFTNYDFGDRVVADDNGWDVDNAQWSKTIFFENPNDGASIKGHLTLDFKKDSAHIVQIEEG